MLRPFTPALISFTISTHKSLELIRHFGAVVLAPFLVGMYIKRKRVSIGWLFVFWPLAVVEHMAFITGYLTAVVSTNTRR